MTGRADGPSRSAQGLRSAISIAAPIALGWALGATGAGLIASLGAFTSRFVGDRPYVNRAIGLASVAVVLAAAVALGDWSAQLPWLGVATVSIVAVAAVWLCNALSIGPPGAYVFVVACAAGVGVSGAGLAAWKIGLLVLAGGTFAWLVQMADVVTGFRGPERRAVANAGEAVAAYIESSVPQERTARHRAATALHNSWRSLINNQPLPIRANSVLHRLLAANHALHLLFSAAVAATAHGNAADPGTAEQARLIAGLELPPEVVVTRDTSRIPLAAPPVLDRLRLALRPGSQVRHIMARIAIAVPTAGAAAMLLGIGHPYWAMATTVLLLHQGLDQSRTLRRGFELLLGTWLGLSLAGGVLLLHPKGLWLAALLGLFQFSIALLAPRKYIFAAIFITATALTIASGTHKVDIGPLLLARGTDVLIGCTVAIPVYLAAVRFQESTRVTDAIGRALDAAAVVMPYIAAGDMAPVEARAARRDLQIAAIALKESDEAALAGSAQHRSQAQLVWPAIAVTERLAYRTIAACWAVDHRLDGQNFGRDHRLDGQNFGRDHRLDGQNSGRPLLGSQTAEELAQELRGLATAARTGAAPPEATAADSFLADELSTLRQSLRADR